MMFPVIGEMTISIRGSNNSEREMKAYKYIVSAAIAATMLVSCAKEDNHVTPVARRSLTVYCPLTKTSIEYEGSDVSHLVWKAGESVGYVTSVSGDRVQLAKISSNSFTAQIPADASKADSIFVISRINSGSVPQHPPNTRMPRERYSSMQRANSSAEME